MGGGASLEGLIKMESIGILGGSLRWGLMELRGMAVSAMCAVEVEEGLFEDEGLEG
jgi:hypothetical protein